MRDKLKEIYFKLNDKKMKHYHAYELKVENDGINLYPYNSVIYNLPSLISDILKINSLCVGIYLDFENGYLRIH